MISMAILPTDKEFLKYFSQLTEAQKKSLLTMLKVFLQTNESVEDRITVEQYNLELEEAMGEIQRGEVYSHEEVIKMVET